MGSTSIARRAAEAADSRSELEKAQDQVARYTGRKVQFAMPSENAMFADADRDPRETMRREITVWGWFLGFIACVLLFGFRISVPVFLIGFLHFQAGANWRSALALWRHRRDRHVRAVREGLAGFAAQRIPGRYADLSGA